jgi:multimeric flavodoxin WrbA
MAEKHVVLLNGSPRRGTTLGYLEQIEEHLVHGGVTTETINLGDHEIQDCTGCERCIRKTTWCIYEDDSREILEKLLVSDGIVISAPVYMGTVPGKLKSLIDKTASWLHRPPAVGKPVLPLVTTAGSGAKRTLAYLTEAVTYWGAHPVQGITRSASDREAVHSEEVATFLRHLRLPKERYRPTLRQVMLFQVQKVLALKVSQLDREYWTKRGWDRRDYFYTCRITPVKRLLGKLLFLVLYRKIEPTDPF